jgi:2-polyprenyl-3-methyl-5-hydroxy-6-metoxy-1,4-benzoquinol methylase
MRSNECKAATTPFDFTKYDNPYEIDRIKNIEALIPEGDQKHAVDIGCGPGYFAKLLSTKGWKTTAIDADSSNIENATLYATETHSGDAIDVLSNMPSDNYHLAIALEIIEHMPKTRGKALIRQVIRILKSGGKFIVSTPNKLSPEGLGGYYWGEKIRRAQKWNAWDPTHVYIYSSWEIIRLLKACDLVVDRLTGYYYKGRLPLIGQWRLPVKSSTRFPFNRIGFDIILECHKK